jgi:hypothetical protein
MTIFLRGYKAGAITGLIVLLLSTILVSFMYKPIAIPSHNYWEFVIVTDLDKRSRIEDAHEWYSIVRVLSI